MTTQARTSGMRRFGAGIALAASALVCAAPAQAAPRPMSDSELSAVSGQGVFAVSNSSLNGFDFMRVALDADVTLNANLMNVRLGEYAYAARNGTGADIDIGALQFGRSDAGVAKQVVQITNPYFEFVFRDTGNGTREAIGMRLGFDGIAGDIGTRLASISGALKIQTSAGTIDTANDALGGKRFDNTCATCVGPALNMVGGVTAGDANGASRDFWISILKTPVTFPSAPGMPALTEAQAGIWMNWRDKLVALNITGAVPPNTPGH